MLKESNNDDHRYETADVCGVDRLECCHLEKQRMTKVGRDSSLEKYENCGLLIFYL